jgi:predicted nucleic acid-binding protein
VSVYLDANVLVALLIPDSLTPTATAAVAKLTDPLLVSDVAALEFASTAARKVREGAISARDARIVLANFDTWIGFAERVQADSADVAAADAMVRRLDVNLHGMDALHVALARRVGAALLTLDAKMKANAKKIGLAVI